MEEDAQQLHFITKQYLQHIPPHSFRWWNDGQGSNQPLRLCNLQDAIIGKMNERYKYPPSSLYKMQLLRSFMRLLEGSGQQVAENVYLLYANLLTSTAGCEEQTNVAPVIITYTAEEITDIYIEECKNVISSMGTTGRRTWEAALLLGEYLLANPKIVLGGKRILELGAGTGFLSLLVARICERTIDPKTSIVASDGDAGVVDSLRRNIAHNEPYPQAISIQAERLQWAQELQDAAATPSSNKFDVVLGADVIYDESLNDLAHEIKAHLTQNPGTIVLLSAAIRNPDTVQKFTEVAAGLGLYLVNVDFRRVKQQFCYTRAILNMWQVCLADSNLT